MRWLLHGLAISLVLAGSLCEAQTKSKTKAKDPKRPYDAGQIIEVNEFSQWIPAKVDGYGLTGIEVILEPEGKFKDVQERLRKRTYSLSQTRLTNGQKPNPGNDDNADDDGPTEKPNTDKAVKGSTEKNGSSNNSTGGKKNSGKKGESQTTKSSGTAKGELYDWTYDIGTDEYSISARFVKVAGQRVTLEKEDGKTITIALKNLDAVGQNRASLLSKAAKPGGGENTPKDIGGGTGESHANKEGKNEAESGGKVGNGAIAVHANWGGVFKLRVDLPESGNYPLDPATPETDLATKKPIALHANSSAEGSFERVERIVFNHDTLKGAMFMVDKNPQRSPVVGIQSFDLNTCTAGPLVPIALPVSPKDISPSGNLVLATSDSDLYGTRGDGKGYVTILKWHGEELTPWRTWYCFGPRGIESADPTMAKFVDEDNVISMGYENELVLWNIAKMKAVYHLELEESGTPVLSPGRNQIACATSKGICIYNALTGKSLVRLPGGNPGMIKAMGFHPNGKHFAALLPRRLMVWDLEKLELERDIAFSIQISENTLDWVGDNYILCGGKELVDLNLRVVLWNYSGGEQGGVVGSDYWYLLTATDRSARAIFPTTIPHTAAKKRSDSLKPEDLLAIGPGATVAIRWAVQGNKNEVDAVYQSFVKQLQDNGLTYAEKSRLVLDVSTSIGKTREIAYQSFDKLITELVTTAEQISTIRFIEGDTVLWEAKARLNAPSYLQLKENETLQQALVKYQQPNIEFFRQVKLPATVARAHHSGAFGHSQLTPRGIVDSK